MLNPRLQVILMLSAAPFCQQVLIHNITNGIYVFDSFAIVPLITGTDMNPFKDLVVFNFFKEGPDDYWLCTNLGVIQITVKQNKFSHYPGYFTQSQKGSFTKPGARCLR
jgi:hypothetical protein